VNNMFSVGYVAEIYSVCINTANRWQCLSSKLLKIPVRPMVHKNLLLKQLPKVCLGTRRIHCVTIEMWKIRPVKEKLKWPVFLTLSAKHSCSVF